MSSAEVWDEDRLELLKASYREVTGRQMPSFMTPEQAVAELHRLMPIMSVNDNEQDVVETLAVIKAAAKLKAMVSRRRKLKRIAQEQKSVAEATGWDYDALELLKASFREVTGRAIPSHMTPDQAAAELKRLCPPIITSNIEDAQDLGRVLMAAVRLKRQMLIMWRRAKAEREAAARANAAAAEQAALEEAKAKGYAAEVKMSKGSASASMDAGKYFSSMPEPSKQHLTGRAAELTVTEQAVQDEAAKAAAAEKQRMLKAQLTSRTLGRGEVYRPGGAGSDAALGKEMYQGWLTKKYKSMLKRDKERWFALYSGGELRYFDGQGGSLVGAIVLRGLTAGQVKVENGTTLTIKGAPDEKGALKDWQLDAPTAATCTTWKRNLDKVISGRPTEAD